MRKTMKKLTRGATRLLVLALGLGLTATGWGAASLEETGGTVPTTATLAFKGATLSQVTADTLSGVIGGDWAGNIAGNAMTFNNFDRSSEASGTITCQAQIQHDTNVKGVLLTFTQDGSNVKVQKTGAKYISGTVGSSIAGGTDGYYDVNKLQLNITRVVPNACWVENFPSSSTTVNGVSLNPVNGSSTVTDGVITYGNPGNANGPAFSFDAAGYVAIVFTVDFTGVTLAENQILFTLGNSANNGLVGAALKSNGSGGFYATGIWTNGTWANADDSSNTVTLSGEQTFLAIYNKGEDASTKGTHLYVLDNGVAKVIYGGTSGIGLKGGDVTKLGIGGAFGSSGSFTNMAGLKLKKVAVYLSSSSLPMTASDLPGHAYMAKFAVANGETINASTINSGATTFGSAYVSTEAGATINLDAELNGHAITFAGSISGVPGSADGLTLGSANDCVTTTVAANVPNIKGSGTVVYNGVTPDSSYSWMSNNSWAGVLWLKNVAIAGLVPGNVTSDNSTLRLTGVTGYFNNNGTAATNPQSTNGALDLQDDGNTKAFTVNNGWSDNGITVFGKLTGSGTLACSTRDISQRYVFVDPSEFTGTINCARTDDSSRKYLKVILGNSTSGGNAGTITVASGAVATVKTGKTWSANKVVVNGTLNMEDSTAALSGTVSGSGKIVYNDELPNSADFTANTWTGTVEVNGGATTTAGIVAADAAQFMNSGSAFTVATGTVTLGTAAGLTGTVNVNSGATLQVVDNSTASLSLAGVNSGTINLQMATALATLTLGNGIARGTIVYPSSLTTLNVALMETTADDGEYSVSCGSATPTAATLTLTRPDGTTVEEVAGTIDGSTVSFAWTPAVSGKACWVDYEMDYVSGSKNGFESTGADTTELNPDSGISGDNAFYNGMLYTYAHPWRNMAGDNAYPSSWTAVVRCTVPAYENAAIITFGTCGGGLIGLVAGHDPETEMKLVKTTGNSAFTVLSTMTVQNATTAQHVYVFEVENNSTIKVYCDGEQVLNETYSAFTLGGGIQIGSVHGGVGNTGIVRFAKNESPANTLSETVQKNARIDCVRLYKGLLGPNAIRQLSVEFPAVKLFRATVADGATTDWDSLTWSPAWDGGNEYSKIILTVEGDATLTLPSSITAEDFKIDVASGHVLTLNRAAGGTTITTTNPMEIDNGTMYLADDTSLGTWEIGGTGTVRLKNGAMVTGALSGTAKVEIPGGSTVGVMGGSIANQITGSGVLAYMALPSSALSFSSWTGTVQLPAIASGGIIFNNYGTTGSTVYLTSMSGAWIDPSYTTINPKLYLAGNMTLAAMSTRTYTFAEIDGSGDLSFATSGDQPTAINITKVAEGYTGTISSTLANPVTIATLDREAGTSTAGGTKLLSTSGDVAASALTVGGAAQQVGLCTAADGIYVACTVTIPEVANASATVTVGGVAAEGSSPYTVDVGSNVEIVWTPDSGYKITAGATQTISSIAANATAIAPTVEEMGAEVSNVNFTYGADYTTAEVTATITGDATSATLTYGGNTYNAQVSNGTATFTDVAVSRDSGNVYAPVSYTITTDAHATTGGTGSTVAADVVAAGWINERAASTTGTSGSAEGSGGSWTNAVTYTDGTATITDNRFEATTMSTSSRVVMELYVCFTATSDENVSGDAQGALKLGEVNSVPTFMVLTTNGEWDAVSHGDFTPDPAATYKVVMTFDYANDTYSVSVADNVLTNSSGSASFPLAANRSGVKNIDFAGTGTLVSMKGDQLEGYMVKDEAGHWYATIEAATSTYNSANGTYTVLHDGTAPSGWKIDDTTKALIKAAVGMFFFAF